MAKTAFKKSKNLIQNVSLSSAGGAWINQEKEWLKVNNASSAGVWAGIVVYVTKGVLHFYSADVYNPNDTDITVANNVAGAAQKSFVIKPKETVRVEMNWLSTVTSSSSYRFFETTGGKTFLIKNFQQETDEQTPYAPFLEKNTDVKGVKTSLKTPKKNLLTKSDINRDSQNLIAGVSTVENKPGINGFQNGIYFKDNTLTRYLYVGPVYEAKIAYTFSFYVKMDDGSIPSVGANNGNFDLSIVMAGGVITIENITVTNVKRDIYRVSAVYPGYNFVPSLKNTGIVKYAEQTSKPFTVSGWQFEEGSLSSFEPYQEINKENKRVLPAI